MEVLQIIHDTHNKSNTPQYLFFDGCTILPFLDGDKIAFEQHQDDEIPSWKLDHMYAKKREPGTEQPKPVKRRSKKKEVLTSQFLIHAIEDPPPKINIIRQRHSINTGYVYSRPKILSSPYSNKFYNSCSSTNSLFSHTTTKTTKTTSNINSSSGYSSSILHNHHQPHHPHNQRKVTKDNGIIGCPSLGAQVTVCNNGVELDNNNSNLNSSSSSSNNNNNSVSSRSHYQPKTIKKNTFSSMSFPTTTHQQLQQQLPSHIIENRSSSLDSIGEDDDPTSLFFDFAMEEEEEGAVTLDVDFNEIQSMNSSATKDETSLNFFHQDCISDNSHLNSNENNRCNSHDVTDEDHEMTDSSLLDNFMTPLLSSWDSSPINSMVHVNNSSFNSSDNNNIVDINNLSLSSTNNNMTMTTTTTTSIEEEEDEDSEITPEVVKRKRGRPFKNKPSSSTLDSLLESTSLVYTSNSKDIKSDDIKKKITKERTNGDHNTSPIRRSTRPVKTKNFFDDM